MNLLYWRRRNHQHMKSNLFSIKLQISFFMIVIMIPNRQAHNNFVIFYLLFLIIKGSALNFIITNSCNLLLFYDFRVINILWTYWRWVGNIFLCRLVQRKTLSSFLLFSITKICFWQIHNIFFSLFQDAPWRRGLIERAPDRQY